MIGVIILHGTYYMSNDSVPAEFLSEFTSMIKDAKVTTKVLGKNKRRYLEIIGSYDIETSDIKCNDMLRNVVYVWTLSFIDFKDADKVTPENIKELTLTLVGRTMHQFDRVLDELRFICANDSLVIYIHNLNYEMDRILNNCVFARANLNQADSINIATHTPLTTVCGNILFKDSWKLFNASLAEVGKIYGMPKLEYEYKKVRLPESKLTETDYVYNANDVYIVIYAICRLCITIGIKSISKIPSTSTRLTVYRNEHTESINPVLSEFARVKKSANGRLRHGKGKLMLSDKYRQSVKDNEIAKEDIDFFEQLFVGGYSHGNIYGANKIWENVRSCDYTSAYPGHMVSCFYPYNVQKIESIDKLTPLLELIDINRKYLHGVTCESIMEHHMRPCNTWFAATVTFKHLKVKVNDVNGKKWCAPVISVSKCLNTRVETKSFSQDNGRILEGENIHIVVNSLDLLAIELCYESFEIISVDELFVAGSQGPMHTYKLNTIKKWYTDKTGLKKLIKWCEKPDRQPLTHDDFINSEYQLIDENAVDEFLELSVADIDEFTNTIEDMYMKSKNSLNGQYGIMVMHINREEVFLNVLEHGYNYVDGGIKTSVQKEFYTHGICITAYTRLHLLSFSFYIAKYAQVLPLYWDTDSVKVAMLDCSNEKLHNVVNEYNSHVHKVRDDIPLEIGTMDDTDGDYKYFKYLGSKRYIYLEKDKRDGEYKVHLTVAGLPKRSAMEYYGELYHKLNDNFEALCDYFRPNTFIHSNICNKLVPAYPEPTKDLWVEGDFVDDDGNVSHVSEWSGFSLVNVPFALVDLSKIENRTYYISIGLVQNNVKDLETEYPPQIIKRDKKGNLIVVKGDLFVPQEYYAYRGVKDLQYN